MTLDVVTTPEADAQIVAYVALSDVVLVLTVWHSQRGQAPLL